MNKISTFLLLIALSIGTFATPRIPLALQTGELRLPKQTSTKHNLLRQFTAEEQDTLTLHFAGFTQLSYYPNTEDWYMAMQGNDPTRPEYGYRVYFAYYAPAENFCGSYSSSYEGINMEDSYLYDPHVGYMEFESVDLEVMREKVSPNLEQIIADAIVVDTNGKLYHITCTHNNISPKDHITANLTNATLQRDEESFTFAAANDTLDAAITIHSPQLLNQYSMSAIDLTSSHFAHNGQTLEILSIQAQVTAQRNNNDVECIASIAFLTKDTVQYSLQLTHTLPAPTQTADIICTNLDVDGSVAEYINAVNFEAYNDDFIISGSWAATSLQEGTYEDENIAIEILDMAEDMQVQSLVGTIHVAKDATNRWTIQGYVRGDNNKVYNLHLNYVVPTPTDTVIVRFNSSSTAIFHPEYNNDLIFENNNEQFYASLNVVGVKMGERFGYDQVDRTYCGVETYATGKTSDLADISGTIYQQGDTTIMHAELISMDATLYDILLWYVSPTPTDTVELSFPVEFGDLRSEQGFYQLFGPSPDTTYVVAFSPMSMTIPGTYVNDGMFGRFGAEGGRYEMAASYTYIATIHQGVLQELMSIEKGQMTVEMNEEGYITALAEVVCANRVLYRIHMTSKYTRIYLEHDTPTGSIDRTYTSADLLHVEDYSDQGYVYVAIVAQDQSDLTAMHFFIDSTDTDILIPEGEYAINKSYRPWTVLANSGITEDGSITTPFYATCSPDGYLQQLYMWTSGTVLVQKKEGQLALEIDALNSYDVPVHIIYDPTLTDTENIFIPEAQPTEKLLHNGQLLIRHGQHTYSATGARVE